MECFGDFGFGLLGGGGLVYVRGFCGFVFFVVVFFGEERVRFVMFFGLFGCVVC